VYDFLVKEDVCHASAFRFCVMGAKPRSQLMTAYCRDELAFINNRLPSWPFCCDSLRRSQLQAERSLLYTTGFRLCFDHPHFQIERLASDCQLERGYIAKTGFTLSQVCCIHTLD
jgi:hypothetical protein